MQLLGETHGPLVCMPQRGSLVYYFLQGHNEQVVAITRKIPHSRIPNYPNLPSQLLCQVHNITLHADKDTDEIYAQTTLQPVKSVEWDKHGYGERPERVSIWDIETPENSLVFPSPA